MSAGGLNAVSLLSSQIAFAPRKKSGSLEEMSQRSLSVFSLHFTSDHFPQYIKVLPLFRNRGHELLVKILYILDAFLRPGPVPAETEVLIDDDDIHVRE